MDASIVNDAVISCQACQSKNPSDATNCFQCKADLLPGGPLGVRLLFGEIGIVGVAIPQTHSWAPARNRYTVNFVYWYPHPITGAEQHKQIDFKKGPPFPCSSIAPQSPG